MSSNSSQSADHVRAYFREFLPTILNQLLMDDLQGLTCCFEIEVDDLGDPPWQLVVEDGRLTRVGHHESNPVCRYKVDISTAEAVVAAELSPQQAFFDQRIQLSGDMEMGLTLSTVLEPFFKRFPYRR